MNRKFLISKLFVCSFAVLTLTLLSANFIIAQCGNYFKNNYTQIRKLTTGGTEPVPLSDWTGDGKSDFWLAKWNTSRSAYDFLIYPSKPTGYWDWDNPITLATPASLNHFQYWRYYEILDFNSDGNMDIVFQGGLNGYQVYRNNGNGSLVAMPESSAPELSYSSRIAFTDINDDDLLDWLYVYSDNSTDYRELRYKLQNPDGSFSDRQTLITGSAENGFGNYLSIKVGDFDGDGKKDIVYSSYANNIENKYVILKNLGNGNFQAGAPVASDLTPYEVADMNNDGRDDVIYGTAGSLVIFYGQANSTFERRQFSGSYGVPAELNGDDNLDVIRIDSTNSYTVMINDGTGGFISTVYPKNYGLSSPRWLIEDFSGDGKADLLDANTYSYPSRTYNMFGEELLMVRENVCKPFGETKAINFDGNINVDVSTWNPNSGNWSSKNAVWTINPDTTSRNFQWGSGSLGDVPAPGDFDGDGKTDYSVYRNSTGVWYVLKSSDSSWMTFQFGISGDIPVPNDYDGGGKTDIAVFRPSNGSWYIWFTETQQFLGVQFGLNGDKPVPADYDGDNKTDIAVFRPDTGVWYYLKSSDNSFAAIQWGISTDIPVPADYDGDGKADLTIYRNGEWWMLRSSNNAAVGIQYGTANDIPVPVYRNSVSADMTIYNPTNNTWNYFANRYSPGIALGGSQDKPIYFGLPNN